MAVEITGKLRLVSGMEIPGNFRNMDLIKTSSEVMENVFYWYPRGRHIRGVAGYVAFYSGLKVKEIFPDLRSEDVLFFDAVPYCMCDKPLLVSDVCDVCKFSPDRHVNVVRYRRYRGVEVLDGLVFRLRVIVRNEAYIEDMEKIFYWLKETGLRVGRHVSAGKGLLEIMDFKMVEVQPLSVNETDDLVLVSDAVLNPEDTNLKGASSGGGTVRKVKIGRTIVDGSGNFRFETIDLNVFRRRGEAIKPGNGIKFNGFSVGDYTGLGFGEVVKLEKS